MQDQLKIHGEGGIKKEKSEAELGSISAVSRVRSLILPEERWMRAHFPEQLLVIEPKAERLNCKGVLQNKVLYI